MKITTLDKTKNYTVTTKYPYVLGAMIANLRYVGRLVDWRIANTLSSIITEHARIKTMDSSVSALDDMDFILFKDDNDQLVVLAEEYIEDINGG